MMKTQIIPAAEIGQQVYEMLQQSVAAEYKGATEEEKQAAIARILEAFSVESFH